MRGPTGTLFAGFALVATLAACDPCAELSDRICDCEKTTRAKIACRQQREQQRNQREITDADREACAAALDTCDCDVLENRQVELCAMSRDDGPMDRIP